MEASTSSALTPLLHAADAWQEVALLLPVLIGLEIVLSADNAIALAAIARKQSDPAAQQRALNLGLVFALLFRVVLILAAQWVLNFRPLMGAGAVYLLWLCLSHFFLRPAKDDDEARALVRQHAIEGDVFINAKKVDTSKRSPIVDYALQLTETGEVIL